MADHTNTLPNDFGAERSVLSSVLRDKDAVYETVRAFPDITSFYTPNHKVVYSAILSLYQDGRPIDITTVASELGDDLNRIGGRLYIVELQEHEVTTAHLSSYISIVSEKHKRRQAIQQSQEVIHQCQSDSNIDDILTDTQLKFSEIGAGSSCGVTHLSITSPSVIQSIIDAETNLNEYLYTGFSSIDEVIGGYESGELITIGGYSGHGKTTYALQTALHIASSQDKAIVIASYEMPREQLNKRLLSIVTKISPTKMKQGNLSEEEAGELMKAQQYLDKIPIYFYYDPGCSINQLIAEIRRSKNEVDASLWIVDYIQLVPTPQRARRDLEVAEITRGLKLAAGDTGIPIIGISQLSNPSDPDSYPKRPRLAKLKESGAIQQDSDIVQFVYMDEFPDQESGIDSGEIILAKQRMGQGRFTAKMIFPYGRWVEKSNRPETEPINNYELTQNELSTQHGQI